MMENGIYTPEEAMNFTAGDNETRPQAETGNQQNPETAPRVDAQAEASKSHFGKDTLRSLLGFFRRKPAAETAVPQPDSGNVVAEQPDTGNGIEETTTVAMSEAPAENLATAEQTPEEAAAAQAREWLNKWATEGVGALKDLTLAEAQRIFQDISHDRQYEDLRDDWDQVIYAVQMRERNATKSEQTNGPEQKPTVDSLHQQFVDARNELLKLQWERRFGQLSNIADNQKLDTLPRQLQQVREQLAGLGVDVTEYTIPGENRAPETTAGQQAEVQPGNAAEQVNATEPTNAAEQQTETPAPAKVEDVISQIQGVDSYRWGIDRLTNLANDLMAGKPEGMSDADYRAQVDNVVGQMQELQQIMTYDNSGNYDIYGDSAMEIKLKYLDPLEATMNNYRARMRN